MVYFAAANLIYCKWRLQIAKCKDWIGFPREFVGKQQISRCGEIPLCCCKPCVSNLKLDKKNGCNKSSAARYWESDWRESFFIFAKRAKSTTFITFCNDDSLSPKTISSGVVDFESSLILASSADSDISCTLAAAARVRQKISYHKIFFCEYQCSISRSKIRSKNILRFRKGTNFPNKIPSRILKKTPNTLRKN